MKNIDPIPLVFLGAFFFLTCIGGLIVGLIEHIL
jgi:hypothetical protein